jgi:hypothetical protein
VRLRGHHLLCLFGFRGLGYSAAFVENMRLVAEAFFGEGGPEVELLDECDDICRACPRKEEGGCAARPDSEVSVRARDARVLMRLGLSAGERRPASWLRDRIADGIGPAELADICAGCEWLPGGYCREGIEAHARACRRGRGA